jgi:hypothetical protein
MGGVSNPSQGAGNPFGGNFNMGGNFIGPAPIGGQQNSSLSQVTGGQSRPVPGLPIRGQGFNQSTRMATPGIGRFNPGPRPGYNPMLPGAGRPPAVTPQPQPIGRPGVGMPPGPVRNPMQSVPVQQLPVTNPAGNIPGQPMPQGPMQNPIQQAPVQQPDQGNVTWTPGMDWNNGWDFGSNGQLRQGNNIYTRTGAQNGYSTYTDQSGKSYYSPMVSAGGIQMNPGTAPTIGGMGGGKGGMNPIAGPGGNMNGQLPTLPPAQSGPMQVPVQQPDNNPRSPEMNGPAFDPNNPMLSYQNGLGLNPNYTPPTLEDMNQAQYNFAMQGAGTAHGPYSGLGPTMSTQDYNNQMQILGRTGGAGGGKGGLGGGKGGMGGGGGIDSAV